MKVSPYLRCSHGTVRCRNRSRATLCTKVGQRGPGGSPRVSTLGARRPPNGRIRSKRWVVRSRVSCSRAVTFAYYEYVVTTTSRAMSTTS